MLLALFLLIPLQGTNAQTERSDYRFSQFDEDTSGYNASPLYMVISLGHGFDNGEVITIIRQYWIEEIDTIFSGPIIDRPPTDFSPEVSFYKFYLEKDQSAVITMHSDRKGTLFSREYRMNHTNVHIRIYYHQGQRYIEHSDTPFIFY